MCRFPPYAFSTAESNTSFEARQISRPVPSPSIKGMIGFPGTSKRPFLNSMAWPFEGRGIPLYEDRILDLIWISHRRAATGAALARCANYLRYQEFEPKRN